MGMKWVTNHPSGAGQSDGKHRKSYYAPVGISGFAHIKSELSAEYVTGRRFTLESG